MTGQTVGYVRVSSADQNPARQLEALGEVDELFQDAASGSSTDRPDLARLRRHVRKGDLVRVKSPDRLARSTRDLLDLMTEFKDKGVAVEFVDNPALNVGTAEGEFMLTVLAAVYQLERSIILERQREGIEIAKAKGTYDRGTKLTPGQIDKARLRIAAGVPKTQIARDLGVSRQTLYDALAGRGRYSQSGSPTSS